MGPKWLGAFEARLPARAADAVWAATRASTASDMNQPGARLTRSGVIGWGASWDLKGLIPAKKRRKRTPCKSKNDMITSCLYNFCEMKAPPLGSRHGSPELNLSISMKS